MRTDYPLVLGIKWTQEATDMGANLSFFTGKKGQKLNFGEKREEESLLAMRSLHCSGLGTTPTAERKSFWGCGLYFSGKEGCLWNTRS